MRTRACCVALVAFAIQSDTGTAPHAPFAAREWVDPGIPFEVSPVALRAVWIDTDACRELAAETPDGICAGAVRRIAF